MKSISNLLLATAVLGAATVMAGIPANKGCASSTTGMIFNGTYDYNSVGACGGACLALDSITFATQNKDCYCGQTLPPAADFINNSTCSYTCPGYPTDICGGASSYSIYTTGLSTTVNNANSDNTSPSSTAGAAKDSPTSTTTAKPSVVTVGGQTVVVTATAETGTASANSSASSSSGPSKAGIAVGIVVGMIAIAALAMGLFLIFRNKRRHEIEEEHKRQAAFSSHMSGKPPQSSGASSVTDTRLDPSFFAQRRMSDGSIADNQDYSRRILKVTNA